MHLRSQRKDREGSILPLVTVCLIAIFAFVALAIDVGLLLVAKTQCQNAADVAAMTAARSLDGSANPDYVGAANNGKNAANKNNVLSHNVPTANVDIQFGSYHYDDSTEKFTSVPNDDPTSPYYSADYTPLKYTPLPTNENYTLARSKVWYRGPTAFARVIGFANLEVAAVSTAAHRPRDFAILLDFSGSMNNESDLWNDETYLGNVNNSPNSTDATVPTFGHYSDSVNSKMISTSTDSRVGKSNITQSVLGVSALVDDFYSHDRGSTANKAFSQLLATATQPYLPVSGETYLPKNNTNSTPPTYGHNIQEITPNGNNSLNGPPFPGYYPTATTGTINTVWKGYTQGPGYFGKTFFVWPPDPDYFDPSDPTHLDPATSQPYVDHTGYPASLNNPPRDWRKRFFLKPGGSYPNFGGPVDDNTCLWDSTGNWRNPQTPPSTAASSPTTSYVINYKAILAWIKASPSAFPTKLRSGRITYYDAIPDDVPAAAYDHGNLNDGTNLPDQNQRFWKQYIDYVIGVWRSPFNAIQTPGHPACSIGPDFTWGTVKISAPVTGYSQDPKTRMHPQDNPKRPRHRFWFGPLTMVQFISDTGLMPGTAHDISMYPAKLGISGALANIRDNHPNDKVSMVLFNRPTYNDDPAGIGAFSQAQYSLGNDYTAMINSLWFPPNSGTNDIRPWDTDGAAVPRAFGDYTSNTATMHGLLVAYNQFSGNTTLRSQGAGGWGRKGASRIVVLETDGMYNVGDDVVNGFHNGGAYNSYYQILPGDTVNSAAADTDKLLEVVHALCNKDDGTSLISGSGPANWPSGLNYPSPPSYPGYATTRKPVTIHTVAFGAVFEPTASGSEATNAKQLLQGISAIGGTRFPDSASDATDGYKWCIGTLDERKEKLKTAFLKIMNSTVPVSLVH